MPVATSLIEGRLYAVVNVNTFQNMPQALLRHAWATFENESQAERLARRVGNWIADVAFVGR